jgi:hypothetical protein|tara:strand:+ start:306 stop:908 length:603 start_codon:yes stop_codon:yes gene_type:complete
MSDNQLDPEQQAAYRESLEEQATLLGVDFHPNISDEKLMTRVKAAKEGSPQEANTDDVTKESENKPTVKKATVFIPQSEMKFSKEITKTEKRQEARQLVRVVVSCNDPAKKEWQGELLEVGNGVIGELRKFIPYGTPWYVPKALIRFIEAKEYQKFYTRRDKHNNETRYGINEKAFNVSYVGNLSVDELADLAKNQAARG